MVVLRGNKAPGTYGVSFWEEDPDGEVLAPPARKPPKIRVDSGLVIALAQCAIACDNPTAALLHQMKRLASVLDEDGKRQIQAMLEWHNAGRPQTPHVAAPSEPPQ